MRIEEFQDAVDTFGDDLMRWPESERRQAAALLDTSADARAILDAATHLRAAFAESSPVRAPAGLADRIVLRARESAPAPAPVFEAAAADRPYAHVWSAVAGSVRQMASLAVARPAYILPLCFLLGFTSSQWRSSTNNSLSTDLTSVYADLAP